MTFPTLLSLLSDTKKTLVVELSESRLAAVLLRPSTIWKYAVVHTPSDNKAWQQDWQQQTTGLSETNRTYLKLSGYTPLGEADLRRSLKNHVVKLAAIYPVVPDAILPVGALCKMQCFAEFLQECFPTTTLVQPQEKLSLPEDLRVDTLRQMIAQTYPPRVDTDYFLRTVKLNEGQAKLEWHLMQILKQGETPPTLQPIAPKEIKLCKAIDPPGRKPTPIQIVIEDKTGKTILTKQIYLPKPIFYLQCWFSYTDDQLHMRRVDKPGDMIIPLGPDLDQEPASQTATPPALQIEKCVDLAFIIDGTMRRIIDHPDYGLDGIPDIEEARQFVCGILEKISQDTAIHARCALCLYGDDPKITGADYDIRCWEFRSPEDLQWLLTHGTDIKATKDLDYEAMLERALAWANQLPWRSEAGRCVVVIGYAPPHPPHGQLHPEKYGFTHEPFTSALNWEAELASLHQKEVQVIGVWTPYPGQQSHPKGLGANHPCMQYSHDVWYKLGERQTYVNLGPPTDTQVMQAIRSKLKTRYIIASAMEMPFDGADARQVLDAVRYV
ncbi:MAG TPA: hypothetical protein PKZ84_11575 [Anaerolineae bacterium]|nr:hypothetical protein [Anaerolineae bacterium]